MKLTSIIELPGQATGAIGAAAAQTPAQSSLSFSDSLLAASKAPTIASAGEDGSPEAASQKTPACQDATTSNAVPTRRSALAQVPATQTLLPQQLSPAVQPRLTNPIIKPKQGSPEQPTSTSDVSAATSEQPIQVAAAPKLTGTEPTNTKPSVITAIQLDVIPSSEPMQVQVGVDPIRTGPTSSGVGSRAIKAQISPSSKVGNKASNGVGTVAPGLIDDSQRKASADEGQNLLLKSFLYVQTTAGTDVSLNAAMNAVQRFAPAARTYSMQGTPSITSLTGSSSTFKSDSSLGQSATFPDTASNVAGVGVQNAFPNTVLNLHSSAPSDVRVNGTHSAEQNILPKEVQSSESNSYLYPQSSTMQSVISDGMSNAMRSSAPYVVPDGVQSPLYAAPLVPPQEIEPVSSLGTSKQVLSTADKTGSNEGVNSLEKTILNVPESRLPSGSSDAISKPVQSETSESVANGKQGPLPKTAFSAPKTTAPLTSSAVRNAVQSATSGAPAGSMQERPLKTAFSSSPIVEPNIPTDGMANLIPSATAKIAPDRMQESAPKTALSFPPVADLNTPSHEMLNAIPSVAPNTSAGGVRELDPKTVPGALEGAAPNLYSHTSTDTNTKSTDTNTTSVQSSVRNTAANAVQDTQTLRRAPLNTAPSLPEDKESYTVHTATPAPVGVQNPLPKTTSGALPTQVTNAPLNAGQDPVPVPHPAPNTSSKGGIVATPNTDSKDQAGPRHAPLDPSTFATGLDLPDTTTSSAQLSGEFMVPGRTDESTMSPIVIANPVVDSGVVEKGDIKNLSSNATGLKQHAQSTSDLAGPQIVSQGTTSSGDQSQSGSSSQGQNGAPSMILANHPVGGFSDTHNNGNASAVQIAPTPAGVAGAAAKPHETTAPSAVAAPKELPVINTAKLIQAMGQSEMRVGVRTNEFGNISIKTSATRDLISAQISLDHGELARTIATHLPEMQAKLGGSQGMEVRIDMSREGSSQGSGMSGGMSNGSSDQSRGSRHQLGNSASNYSANSYADLRSSKSAAAMTSGDDRLNARLDIRI